MIPGNDDSEPRDPPVCPRRRRCGARGPQRGDAGDGQGRRRGRIRRGRRPKRPDERWTDRRRRAGSALRPAVVNGAPRDEATAAPFTTPRPSWRKAAGRRRGMVTRIERIEAWRKSPRAWSRNCARRPARHDGMQEGADRSRRRHRQGRGAAAHQDRRQGEQGRRARRRRRRDRRPCRRRRGSWRRWSRSTAKPTSSPRTTIPRVRRSAGASWSPSRIPADVAALSALTLDGKPVERSARRWSARSART